MTASTRGRLVRPTLTFTGLGAAALTTGAVLYLVARGPGSSGLPGGLGLDPWPALTGSLPALLHTLAFALLAAAALGPTPRVVLASAAGWTAIGAAFEALQHPTVAHALLPRPETLDPAGTLAGWAASIARYAHLGTFDPGDLLATAIGGALAAWLGLRVLRRGGTA